MGKTLAIVKTEERKPKPQRERIQLIETLPCPEWFMQATLKTGRRVWYLRLQITGIFPRLYGPFKTRHTALLFLDYALNELADFWSNIDSECNVKRIKSKFEHTWPPIIEHPLATKGR